MEVMDIEAVNQLRGSAIGAGGCLIAKDRFAYLNECEFQRDLTGFHHARVDFFAGRSAWNFSEAASYLWAGHVLLARYEPDVLWGGKINIARARADSCA